MKVCKECGDSVERGSGKFVNRIPCLDDNTYVCAECKDNKLIKGKLVKGKIEIIYEIDLDKNEIKYAKVYKEQGWKKHGYYSYADLNKDLGVGKNLLIDSFEKELKELIKES